MNPNAFQAVNSWLEQLNPSDKGLVLDQNGQCQLAAGDGSLFTIFVPGLESALFHLYADILQMPEGLGVAFYEDLLALNLLGMKTLGGILGLDKQMRSMVFSYSGDIATTHIAMFCTVLDNFSVAATEMKKRLNALLRPDPPAGGSTRMPHRRFR